MKELFLAKPFQAARVSSYDTTGRNGDAWPLQPGECKVLADLQGTGSEDYLCHAWGMQHAAQLYCGEPWAEKTEGIQHHLEGKVCVYRYHVLDPIPFSKSLRVTIEHGDSNDRSDDFSSVAYWYQDEPHTRFAAMLPAELRLPD